MMTLTTTKTWIENRLWRWMAAVLIAGMGVSTAHAGCEPVIVNGVEPFNRSFNRSLVDVKRLSSGEISIILGGRGWAALELNESGDGPLRFGPRGASIRPQLVIPDFPFSNSVDFDGRFAIAGSERSAADGPSAGSAVVFRSVESNEDLPWEPEGILLPDRRNDSQRFGRGVSVFDLGEGRAIAVVGALGDNFNGSFAGAIFIYERQPAAPEAERWILSRVLRTSSIRDFLGWTIKSVRLDDGRLLIVAGAPGARSAFGNTGIARTFIGTVQPSGKVTWNLGPIVFPRMRPTGTGFFSGSNMALSSRYLMMGGTLADIGAFDTGSPVFIFRIDVTPDEQVTFTQEASISPAMFVDGGKFGSTLSLAGDIAMIGHPKPRDSEGVSGIVHLYSRTLTPAGDASWNLISDITSPCPEPHRLERFGTSGVLVPTKELGLIALISSSCRLGRVPDVTTIRLSPLFSEPPTCPDVQSLTLWPPNHSFQRIDLNDFVTVTDPDGDEVVLTIDSVTQDEPVNELGDGNTDCDVEIVGDGVVFIRRERSGNGNGRVYEINYFATDSAGCRCESIVEVHVPKDIDISDMSIDDGQIFDGTDCTSSADVNDDHNVDFADITMILASWGAQGLASDGLVRPEDVNADGVVAFSDLVGVLMEWETSNQ